jgi:CheY-like chemotaxis protein
MDRVILRAELFHDNRHIVAHTTELSPRSAFVCTDERLDLGALVQLRLSFPGLLPAIQIGARVVSRDAGSGHGYWPGFALDFTSEEARLSHLLLAPRVRDATRTYQILIVEDSATMRDIIKHNAAQFSAGVYIEVTAADSVEAALSVLETRAFDLLVVDYFLPAPSGADLVRDLRARGLDVPVIGVSIGGPPARRAFVEAGVDLYLDKPVMLRDVFGTVERLVGAAKGDS